MVESIVLAAAGRLPTPEEKRVTLFVLGTAQDKKAAWIGVARAFAGK
jgi:hypothetical protein